MRKKGRDTALDNVKTAQGCIPGETFCSTCSRTSEKPLCFASTLNCGSWRDPDTVFQDLAVNLSEVMRSGKREICRNSRMLLKAGLLISDVLHHATYSTGEKASNPLGIGKSANRVFNHC